MPPPPTRPPRLTAAPPVTWRWGAALAVALAVVGLAAAPLWLPPGAAWSVREAFRTVCHQMPGRSFHVEGVAFAVCHRCTGLYAGVAAGVLVWPLVRARVETPFADRLPLVLALALAPLALDWGLAAVGLWTNTAVSQTATGAVFGAVAGLLLARGVAQVRTAPPVPRPVGSS